MCPIFVGSVDIFCKILTRRKQRSLFDQFSKLYFSLNAQPEIQILNRLFWRFTGDVGMNGVI